MADDMHLLSRSVVCPRCHADAVISFAPVDEHADQAQRDTVYLCPNNCALQPYQAAALIAGRRA